VEEGNGGMAAFFAAAVGSHAPRAGGNTFESVESMGRTLAVPTLEHLRETFMTNLLSLQSVGLEVSLPSIHARVTDGIRLRPWLSRRLLPVSDKTFVQVLRLNDAIWISTPCDFSGELALDIKDTLFRRGFQANVTSFNGDYIGYIIPSRYYHLSGYEPRVMSFFGPTMPDYLQELMRTMAIGVTASASN
jgi:neutral ceramidase